MMVLRDKVVLRDTVVLRCKILLGDEMESTRKHGMHRKKNEGYHVDIARIQRIFPKWGGYGGVGWVGV